MVDLSQVREAALAIEAWQVTRIRPSGKKHETLICTRQETVDLLGTMAVSMENIAVGERIIIKRIKPR